MACILHHMLYCNRGSCPGHYIQQYNGIDPCRRSTNTTFVVDTFSQTNASPSVDVFRGTSPGAYSPCPPLRRRVRRRCQQLVAAPSRIAGLATMPPPILFPAVPTHRSANKLDDAKKNKPSVPAMRHLPMSRLIRRGMTSRGPSRPEVTDRRTKCLRQVSNWNVVSCERARKTRLRTAPVGRVNVKFHISELAKPPLWTQPTRIGRN